MCHNRQKVVQSISHGQRFLFFDGIIKQRKTPLLLFVLVLFLSTLLLADYPPLTGNPSSKSPLASQETSKQDNVRSLLLQLNEVHKVLPKEKETISFPNSSNYGFVRPILHEIAEYEVDALPVLIDFIDNGNYLYSQTGVYNMAPGQVMACTVGGEARKLFIALVDPTGGGISYKGRMGIDGKFHVCPTFYPNNNDLKEWWRNHSRKTLLEIQTEILDDHIEQEKKIGFPGDNDKATYLEPLQKLKTQLPITHVNYYLKPTSPVISTETKPPAFNNPPINKANR